MPRKAAKSAPDLGRYFFEVYGHIDLGGDWQGWRLRGRWLIAPTGERILPRRLLGMLWRESLSNIGKPRFGRVGIGSALQIRSDLIATPYHRPAAGVAHPRSRKNTTATATAATTRNTT